MIALRRMTQAMVAMAVTVLVGMGPAPAAEAGNVDVSGRDNNEAMAVNTQDGASVFRLAFSVVQATDGVVDQENLAVAYASCTDCRTVALAFQVVIVVGDANYVAPVNQAGALNDKCTECLTFASATQIVIGVDGPVKLTPAGWRRLAELAWRVAQLEANLDQLTAAQLATEVSAIEQELIAILDEELVPADRPHGGDGAANGPGAGGGAGGPTTSTVPGAPSTTVTSSSTSAAPPTTEADTTPTSTPATTAPADAPVSPDTTVAGT